MTAMLLLLATGSTLFLAAGEPSLKMAPKDLAGGQQVFIGQCARCHGMQGRGGFGPSLTRPKLRNAPDFASLINVISNGIPGTAMPAAWQLWAADMKPLAAYVLSLGKVPASPLPGDPARGKAIYDTKGQCATCHIIRKQGGTRGPDLTEIGLQRGIEHLRQALLDPGAFLPEDENGDYGTSAYLQFLPVRVETADGTEIKGVRLNEDSFTIQVRDEQGTLHSLRKSELKQLNKNVGKSIMPDYQTALSAAELEDLVAYLASLRGDQ